MIFSGLFLASFPDDNVAWAPWSRALDSIAHNIIPVGGETLLEPRYSSTGCSSLVMVVYGMFFSRVGRRLLSHPFMNFLGRISFPIYLLRDTLIRTVLSWVIYRKFIFEKGLHPLDEEGKPMLFDRGGFMKFAIAIPSFYILLVWVAYQWTVHVDSICEKVITWLGKKAFGEDSESEALREGTLGGMLKY
ncbi:hypothetical protein N7490_008173 [Penicillium lividum]|nr:hypothetical protein N7490_008173 [Penicillium lividum]